MQKLALRNILLMVATQDTKTEKKGADLGGSQRQTRMPGLRLLDRVHAQGPDCVRQPLKITCFALFHALSGISRNSLEFLDRMEPGIGLEPTTHALRKHCSTN